MSLFKGKNTQLPNYFDSIKSPILIEHIDISKRYDIYCHFLGEERLYENVKHVGIRMLEDIPKNSRTLIGGLLEIESIDGTRIMIPKFHVHTLCEHGKQPSYKVIRASRGDRDTPSPGIGSI